jgi:hypothetical protein
MRNLKQVMLSNDQPVSCYLCGSRTDIIVDLSHINNQPQVHRCLNDVCKNEFVVETEIQL